jgi:hypothetical protein
MAGRPHFGTIRELPSGRFQARYRHLGDRFAAPETFRHKADARAFLSVTEADILRGAWVNPLAGRVRLDEYANMWMDRRPDLAPRTKDK